MKKWIWLISINFLIAGDVFVFDKYIFNQNEKNINMLGNKFIVIDIDNGIGNFYAYEKNGNLFLKGKLSAGNPETHRTPEGIFSIIDKKEFHMSTLYPSDNGKNNMDNMIKITYDGIALHKGSINHYSHGCIHIQPNKSKKLYNWTDYKTKVIITRDLYKEFLE